MSRLLSRIHLDESLLFSFLLVWFDLVGFTTLLGYLMLKSDQAWLGWAVLKYSQPGWAVLKIFSAWVGSVKNILNLGRQC